MTSVSSTTSPILDITNPVTEEDSGRLLLGKVQMLIRHSPVGIGSALLVALLETAVLWGVADRDLLLLWIGSIMAVTVIRLAVVAAYRYFPPAEEQANRWVWLISLGNLTGGIVWGSSILMFDPNGPLPQQIVIILSLAGVSAGSISPMPSSIPPS
ncbi:MAG: hypothetical protein ACE5FQ_10580 [Thiogranum sp.]